LYILEIAGSDNMKKRIIKNIIVFLMLILTSITSKNISFGQNLELTSGEIEQIILNLEQKNSPPNDLNFFSILSQIGNKRLSTKIVLDLYQKIKKRQNPPITKEQLLKIIKSKQESITNFTCNYEYILEEINTSSKEHIEYEIVFKKNKHYIEVKPIATSKKRIHFKKSYDGDKMINLMLDTNFPQAYISQDTSLNTFGELTSPFIISMLSNATTYHLKHKYYDFVLFLNDPQTIIYEKKEKVDNCECIVVSDLKQRIYLDIERDYSVIKKENYTHLFKQSEIDKKPVLVGAKLVAQTRLYNIKNYGNGIWLPENIETNVKNKNGNIVKKEFIKSLCIKINENVDDSYFTNIIPDNALVSDGIRKLVYKQSDHASIGALLKETVKPKSTRLYQRISVITGLIMIVIAVVFEIRKRILQRRAS
jgi:hypothetical protein